MMGFAKIISFFLSPVFILFPIPFILVVRFSGNYTHALKWTLFSYVFILAVAVFVIIGVWLKVFSNFDVSKREQRPLLFSFSAFAAFCYLLTLLVLNGPKVLYVGFFAVSLGLGTIIVVNRWIKASIHLAVISAVFLFMEIVYQGYFLLLFAFIPLLAWSRVKLKEHSPMETVIGSILGIVVTLIVYIVGREVI